MATRSSYSEDLVWESLDPENNELPKTVRDAVRAVQASHKAMEEAVKEAIPAPQGKRWKFSYKYEFPGCAHAKAAPAKTSYFSRG